MTDKPLRQALAVDMVKLTADGYSRPKGAIGAIDDYYVDKKVAFVSWIGGGKSGPICEEHLDSLGELLLRLPEEN
jgi:hypothetical protein